MTRRSSSYPRSWVSGRRARHRGDAAARCSASPACPPRRLRYQMDRVRGTFLGRPFECGLFRFLAAWLWCPLIPEWMRRLNPIMFGEFLEVARRYGGLDLSGEP
jgi:hypothetical protein